MTHNSERLPSGFPIIRGRRNRLSEGLRRLTEEHRLHASDFIAPLFVMEGTGRREPIASMPGCDRLTMDLAVEKAAELFEHGIRAVLLFAQVPEDKKDNSGQEALREDALMSLTIRALKVSLPELVVMTDVALDPYSKYGHDGVVRDGKIVNDETLPLLAQMAVIHAQAGADMVAPSDMMDGRVGVIRQALDARGFTDTGIMAYSAKYASCFYGPFRDALDSAPGFGDKKTYQMHPPNAREAVREALMDQAEGADLVMVKPGLAYLDIVQAVSQAVQVPVAVYNVSAEYAMIKAAARQGWLNEEQAMMETLIAFKRAGAAVIATYWAGAAAKLIRAMK